MSFDILTALQLLWPAAIVSLAVAIVIVATKAFHLRWTARGHAGAAIQSAHHLPTPRIGGVAVLAGLVTALWALEGEAARLTGFLVLSALPVFIAGLMEDVGMGASPRLRLLMAGAGGLIMVALTGAMIRSGGLPGTDWLLAFTPLALVFTIFATAGVAHAFNLVDGLNGLSKAITISVVLAFGVMAYQAGDPVLALIAAAVVLVVLGVFVVNYPLGKVFLGDAGAYTLGHVTAWLAVLLMARHPEISPWAVLLAAFWPVMDTAVAIWRRWRRALPADAPDRMHFHHLVLRLLCKRIRRPNARARANPLATAALAPLFVIPPGLAILLATSNLAALLAYAACAAAYVTLRLRLYRRFRRLAAPRATARAVRRSPDRVPAE